MALKSKFNSLIDSQKNSYRYSKELNTSYVDIGLGGYLEAYNEWDFSPATNRDLDEDLFQYLEESVVEIPGGHNICIVFNIPVEIKDKKKEDESIQGLANYFNYEVRRDKNKRSLRLRTGTIYGFWGLIFLFLATLTNVYIGNNTQYQIFSFISEGFLIGGWVLIWELCSIAFFGTEEHSIHLKTLMRIRDAKIEFNYR
jgi:hypothetical protein